MKSLSHHKPPAIAFPHHRIQDGRAHYVACHNESYVEANKFDVVKLIRKGGTFFLNTKIAALPPSRRLKALEAKITPKILRKPFSAHSYWQHQTSGLNMTYNSPFYF